MILSSIEHTYTPTQNPGSEIIFNLSDIAICKSLENQLRNSSYYKYDPSQIEYQIKVINVTNHDDERLHILGKCQSKIAVEESV